VRFLAILRDASQKRGPRFVRRPRRLETERLERHVDERRAALERELAARRATLDEQREQLDVMRQKAELLTAAPGDGSKAELLVGDAEVEVALLRERQKRQPS
jgi:uncharacterized membrane-anchored protein YhcB (DUF1043 family)